MTRPICYACLVEMVPIRNEITVEIDGLIRFGDLLQCPACDATIIAGLGAPIPREQGEPYTADALHATRRS